MFSYCHAEMSQRCLPSPPAPIAAQIHSPLAPFFMRLERREQDLHELLQPAPHVLFATISHIFHSPRSLRPWGSSNPCGADSGGEESAGTRCAHSPESRRAAIEPPSSRHRAAIEPPSSRFCRFLWLLASDALRFEALGPPYVHCDLLLNLLGPHPTLWRFWKGWC